MGFRARTRTNLIDLAATWRMLRHFREFSPKGEYTCSRYVSEHARRAPYEKAILFEDQCYTWRDFDAQASRYARFFRAAGVTPGDAVALLMDNRPEFLFAVTGLVRIGAVAALINTQIKGAGLSHAVGICEPKLLVVGAEHLEAVEEVRDSLDVAAGALFVHAEDGAAPPAGYESMNEHLARHSDTELPDPYPARGREKCCYIYTSGTTGLPKAAIITHRRWVAASYLFGSSMMEATPRDCIYVSLPLYHSSAMFGGFGASLVSGASLALRRRFSASQFWPDVRKFDASIVLYIGELCRYLLNGEKGPDERSHRVRLCVGNGLRPDIWPEFQRRFAIPRVCEFYGATEGNAPMANVEGRPGMVGRLRPGQVLARCDEASGELVRNQEGFCERVEREGEKGILLGHINRVTNFDGYLDRGATDSKVVRDVFAWGDRYFNSGDILQLHENHWVSFADRVGDTFRWKGENVSTNEVAEVLNGAPGVLETNVYGVEVPGAEGRAGMSSVRCGEDFSLEDFAQHVLQNLASYQRPYFLRLQRGMRVTSTFKHQKVAYREEGFDPTRVGDPLYFLDGEKYVPIDGSLYARLTSGELRPR